MYNKVFFTFIDQDKENNLQSIFEMPVSEGLVQVRERGSGGVGGIFQVWEGIFVQVGWG